jgi:hypothetical protein
MLSLWTCGRAQGDWSNVCIDGYARWNPAVEDQAIDRVHRIGQEKIVMVHKLTIDDTVEERIVKMQEAKVSWLSKVASRFIVPVCSDKSRRMH